MKRKPNPNVLAGRGSRSSLGTACGLFVAVIGILLLIVIVLSTGLWMWILH